MARRVCVFCEIWESGGIESFLTNAILRMDRSGLEIDLVAERLGDSVFTEPLRAAGVRFIELSGSTRNMARNFSAFRRLLRERRYDVLHLNIYQGLSLRYAEIAKGEGVPVRIAHSHGNGLRKSALRPLKLLIHYAARAVYWRYATVFAACSHKAAQFLFSDPKGTRIICNGIDTERFRFSEEARNILRADLGLLDKAVLGCVGRFSAEKNQLFLLEMMPALLARRPDAVLLLVGDGDEKKRLRERAVGLGIEKSVIFYGVSDNVPPLLCAMDAFAMPSTSEGFGIAAIEAQASGLAVIASDRVPDEAMVTELIERLSLSVDKELWAEKIAARFSRRGDREIWADVVRGEGLDVGSVAFGLRELYG